MLLEAFPDLQLAVQDIVVEGENVVTRWEATATHNGSNLGFAATGQTVKFAGMTWQRYVEGKIVGGWDAWNQGAVLESLRSIAQAKAGRTEA